ncbi:MAG TPA: Ig-like domain-containing protein [Vitreimonas sp.]|nr:Ig-like domain-containing protein [Vitreimonas sp.]
MNEQNMQTVRDALYPSSDEFMKRTSQVSSRLTKHEQKRMLRQTLLIASGAVILFVVFLFVIVPGLIRFMTSFFGDTKQITSDDTIPPQIPIISAPVPATSSATLAVSGYGEAGSELVVLVNEAEDSREKVRDDGSFNFIIDLTEGDNKLALYAVDAAGNESSTSKTYTVSFDPEPPKLEVSEPTNGQTYETRKNQVISIKGSTDENGGVRILINGRIVNPASDGNFSTTYQLQEGENTLLIQAKDRADNTTETELKVTFKP